MKPSFRALFAAAVVASLGAACKAPQEAAPQVAAALPELPTESRTVSFEREVKPLLEARCVVCHACYDAPCQLQLGSPEGIARGATKLPVYDTSRLENAEPTRLGIDAHGADAWRARGFHSVVEGSASGESLLVRMLALGVAHPFAAGERLPASVDLDINRTLSCAAPSEFDAYAREHPDGGMPYGTARLGDDELKALASWLAQGAPAAALEPPQPPADVEVWETFLNGASLKERVVARYLYEHWFVAHLALDGGAGPYYRVVRSRTAPGSAIDEIATVRPYDDPGGPFWYRLRPVEGTIVRKTNIVYPLGPAKLARLRQLFLGSDWKATRFPSYEPEEAANPFVAFAEIPPKSRYQYMLDDAQYFVMTFIRGPVCRGQVAVDVIEDQFFIAFADPARDLSVVDPTFLTKNAHLLDLPAEHAEQFAPGQLWLEYNLKQREYLDVREKLYDQIDPKRRGPALAWVWDGGGTNPNALLTVFRNFDNAEVVKGFVGEIPKTAWVMDYPIFERIYYNLVAGYDVYGKLTHQVATRLYMDHLRMQSENLFLMLLPADRREAIRASWYVGATRQMDYFVDALHAHDHGTQIKYQTDDPKRELIEMLLGRSPAVAGPPDLLNRCAKPPCDRKDATPAERGAERALQRIAAVKGPWVQLLPEVSLLRVRVDATGEHDLLYSLVHNDAHTNVAFMFGEDKRRLPEDDTVTVVRGAFGSYPNFFFEVDVGEVDAFVDGLAGLASDADLERFSASHGIRRTDPRFWATADWLREQPRKSPPETGLYDLGRYGNL